MMMSFALMGCLIIGASDASAQGRSRSQGGSTSSRSQTAAVSRSSNTVAPAATRSTSTVSRSTSATTPQVTRSTTTTTSRATTTPQATRSSSSDRITTTTSRSTTTPQVTRSTTGSSAVTPSTSGRTTSTTTTSRSTTTPQVTRSTTGSSAVTPSTSGRTTSTTTSRSTTTPQVTRSTTGSSTRTVAPSTSGRTTSTTTTQVSKPSTSHQSTSTTINNGGTTSSRATGGASTRDNMGSKVTRSNDMGSRADTDIKGRTTNRTSPDISGHNRGDKDDKGGRPGGNGNGRHDNGGKPGNDGNHDNGGKPGRGHQGGYGGSHNHFDYANHHYRNEFSWNYSHHNWSRACPPPSRPYRPAPIVWYRPVIPVGWYPYAGAPLIDRILGMNFGMLFDLSLDYLYYNGYEIDGYADHVIYLRNVRLLNYLWDDVMLCYDSHNQLVNAQFVFLSSSYGRNHFNRIYNSLCRVYGYPFTNSDGSYSWYGGNNTGWVTLSSHHNLGHSYTTLSIGY